MNGYIGGLLGRTLGDAPLLRPRTPSLFEPAPAEPEPSSAPPLPGQRVITKTVVAPGEVREHERIVREEVPVVHEEVRTVNQEHVRTVREEVPVERERTVIEERPIRLPAPRPAEPVEDGRSRLSVSPERHEQHDPDRWDRLSSTTPRAIALPEPPPMRSGLPPARDGLQPVPTHIHHHAGNHVLVQRTLPRRIEHTTRVEAAPPAVVDTAPDIRITIGRVDVRAVVRNDASRPGAREPQKPRLSLEDYLRGQR